MVDIDTIRARIRDQLTQEYLKEVREGHRTVAQIQELLPKLEDALMKAERSGERVIIADIEVEGSGGLNADEIQDQIAALRRVLGKV